MRTLFIALLLGAFITFRCIQNEKIVIASIDVDRIEAVVSQDGKTYIVFKRWITSGSQQIDESIESATKRINEAKAGKEARHE
jgi:hypothetical protein